MKMNHVRILLVEDDEVDRMAVRRAFREQNIEADIVEARDGSEAMDILLGRGAQPEPKPPYLILLDLNMPQLNGIEFLRELRSGKTDPVHRNSIVFILTTSSAEQDIKAAHELNVAGYMVKSDFDRGLPKIVGLINDYAQVVEFPRG